MSVLQMETMSDRLAMMIESLVDYMGVSTGSGQRSLVRYDRAVPFMPEVLAEISPTTPEQKANNEAAEARGECGGTRVLDAMVRIPPPPDLDFSWISTAGGSHPGARTKWAANRVRRVNPKHCRGATIIAPYMAEQWVAIVDRDATYQEVKFYVAWMGGRWRFASQRHPIPHLERQTEFGAGVGVFLQEDVSHGWQAVLGYEGSPRIRFATTAEGVLECFRMRDIPNGKSRRAALVHWVNGHWRKTASVKPETESTLVEVRRHLRGQRSFSWNGLSCEIVPSLGEYRVKDTVKNDAKGRSR